MGFDAPSLKGRALRYLSQREHSRAELERKLARFAEEQPEASAADQIAQALDDLAARGFQSEGRVAASVLHSQGARYGQRRLRQTLMAKGLAPELVSSTLQAAKTTELARAREVWRKKFGTPAVDAAGRAKQARFLVARGFDADVVRRVVAGLDDE
ncbi:MAG: recombination regulator RecX [Rubrivivax sp.]|jgi:regulatory protein